jgi:diaminohydroxyphosphoribosylaminopyrimidine deaminase/5-amino-6-(5-phosphoribosylamino)uracil reductase
LDGKLASASGESKWISSEASRREARRFRGTCDAILVGAGTVLRDNPGLLPEDTRHYIPRRVILDPRCRLSGREKLFRDRYASRSLWIAGPDLIASRERVARSQGAELRRLKARKLGPFLREAAKFMASLPLRQVLVEGGSQTHAAFLEQGLADEVLLYLAPALLGGAKNLGRMTHLKNLELGRVGPDLRVRGYVQRNH